MRVYRNAGGFHDWTNSTTGTALGYRNDYAAFQRASGAWKRIETRGRAGVRRENVSRDLTPADNGATIAVIGTATYTLPLAVGQSTGWRVTLEQRGVGYVTLAALAGGTHSGRQQHLADHLRWRCADHRGARQRGGEGRAPAGRDRGAGDQWDLVVHEGSQRAGRDCSTATGAVTFQLDNLAPVGASGLLIKGARRHHREPRAQRRVRPAGRRLQRRRPDLLTDNFRMPGHDGLGGHGARHHGQPTIRKYLITGQTSLAFADPIELGTDTSGVLPLNQGGTGLTAADNAALLTGIGGLPTAGGTMTGAIAMGGQNLTNVGRIDATTSVPRAVSMIPAGPYTLLATDNGSILTFGSRA